MFKQAIMFVADRLYEQKHIYVYRIAGMFGGVNVWRIGRIKSIWRKKFSG